uniref:BHLH domain-containing protein n=1 Tax=Ditylum brightwellii TaxID=49249 RepID=A0A7S4RA40_9STRA
MTTYQHVAQWKYNLKNTQKTCHWVIQQQQQQQQQQPQGFMTAASTAAPSTGYTAQSLQQSCVSSVPFGIAPPPPLPPPPSCFVSNTWEPANSPATVTSSTATTSAANTTTAATQATKSFPAVTSLPLAPTGIRYPPLPVVNNLSQPYNPTWTTPAQLSTQTQSQPQQSWNPAPPNKRPRAKTSTSSNKRRSSSISTVKKTPLPVLTPPMTALPQMVSEYDDSGTDDQSTSTGRHNYHRYSLQTNSSTVNPYNVISASSTSELEKSKKRRHDRNLREQERAHRITSQITHLRNVLASANIRFKPDKYSTLISVVDYIKTLQRRSALLDDEHRKLLDTISRTGEMVNGIHRQHCDNNTDGARENAAGTRSVNYDSAAVVTSSTSVITEPCKSSITKPAESTTTTGLNDDLLVFVRGLDYKSIFSHCGVALGVAAVDGRFIDANEEFIHWSGYTRQELLNTTSTSVDGTIGVATTPPSSLSSSSSSSSETSMSGERGGQQCTGGKHLSLFNLLIREDMERVFSAMSRMLKSTGSDINAGPSNDGGKDRGKKDTDASGAAKSNITDTRVYVDEGNHWTGVVRKSRKKGPDVPLRLNITMVRCSDGRPKFFNCALTPEDVACTQKK